MRKRSLFLSLLLLASLGALTAGDDYKAATEADLLGTWQLDLNYDTDAMEQLMGEPIPPGLSFELHMHGQTTYDEDGHYDADIEIHFSMNAGGESEKLHFRIEDRGSWKLEEEGRLLREQSLEPKIEGLDEDSRTIIKEDPEFAEMWKDIHEPTLSRFLSISDKTLEILVLDPEIRFVLTRK